MKSPKPVIKKKLDQKPLVVKVQCLWKGWIVETLHLGPQVQGSFGPKRPLLGLTLKSKSSFVELDGREFVQSPESWGESLDLLNLSLAQVVDKSKIWATGFDFGKIEIGSDLWMSLFEPTLSDRVEAIRSSVRRQIRKDILDLSPSNDGPRRFFRKRHDIDWYDKVFVEANLDAIVEQETDLLLSEFLESREIPSRFHRGIMEAIPSSLDRLNSSEANAQFERSLRKEHKCRD